MDVVRLTGCLALLGMAVGCAEGVGFEIEAIGQTNASANAAGELPPPDGGSSEPPTTDDAMSASTGTPCMMGEAVECVCASTGTMGSQTCKFDLSSPTGGSLGECERCAEPDPDGGIGMGGCNDGVQSDLETDIDCGGPDCDTCGLGEGCRVNGDCSAGECFEGACTEGDGPTDPTDGSDISPPPDPPEAPPPPPTQTSSCSSPCTQPCIPFGILACCRANGTCGCTWAPGAYCL